MRLTDLSLLRWGAFSDRTIPFRPEARLHLLYGPNEAGKTTVLRAVRDLLFGIERLSTYASRHGANVRLGGTLVASDGATLSFRRRRGNSATVLDAADKALPDGALAPFVGAVDRSMFQDLFGLDHQAMRDGAEAMLQAEGELGSSLFAAAGGVRNLVRVRGTLSSEANDLFSPRRSAGKRFYKALDVYDEALKRERDIRLPADVWRDLERAQADAAAEEQRLGEAFHIANRRRAALERLRRAAPILRQLERLRRELSELSDAPLLPADFRERVETVRLALDKARSQRDMAAAERDRCSAERQAITPDQVVLASATLIEEANQGTGRHTKDQADVEKLERDLRRYDDEVAVLLASLVSPGQPLPQAEAGPSEPDEKSLRQLASDQRAWVAARDQAQKNFLRADLACQERRQQRDALAVIERPTAERAMLDQIHRRGPVEQAAAAALRTVATARQAVEEALGRLGLAGWPVATAAALALPEARTVEAFGRRFEQSDQSLRDLTREHEREAETVARLDTDRAELEAASMLPTPQAIDAARRHRDTGWRLVRDTYMDARPRPADLAAYGESLPDAFEAAVLEADRLADRRDAEADRLARHAQLSRDLARGRARLTATDDKLTAAREARQRLEEEWAGIWQFSLGARASRPRLIVDAIPAQPQTAGETPAPPAILPPPAMLDWLRRHADFLRLLNDVRATEDSAAQAAESRDEVRRQLAELLARLGETAPDGAMLADLLAQAEGALARRETAFDAWRTVQSDLAQAEELAAAERVEEARLAAVLADWQQQWDLALRRSGLPVGSVPQAVEVMLKIWGEIRAKRRERHDAARRLDGLKRDIVDYRQGVATLTVRVGGDPSLPVIDAVALMLARLAAARSARDKAADLDRRAEAQRLAEDKAALRIAEGEADLAALLRLCGAASLEDLPDRLRRSAERAEAERQLTVARRSLSETAPGSDEADLSAAVVAEGKDDDALDAELTDLGERLPRLAEERSQAAVAASTAAAELQALRGGASAADAAQDARNALAELRGVTEEWMRLRAAELLLARAIDTFRANAQDPMVRRAGELFGRVTLGAYQGLAVDYDAGDSPTLVGVDAQGERCPVGLMSDGTRDQLYLALRIASIERYGERAEPMPFLADDLFINWDDRRTEEGIAVLAELGGSTQTLLLTHHLAIVEAARRRVPSEQLDIIRLDDM